MPFLIFKTRGWNASVEIEARRVTQISIFYRILKLNPINSVLLLIKNYLIMVQYIIYDIYIKIVLKSWSSIVTTNSG